MLKYLLTLLSQIKIWHWQTQKHSIHKELDAAYNTLSELVDDYVETYQGKHNKRLKLFDDNNIILSDYVDEKTIIKELNFYINLFITDSVLANNLKSYNGDIVSIIDDIVAELNRLKYLLSFDNNGDNSNDNNE